MVSLQQPLSMQDLLWLSIIPDSRLLTTRSSAIAKVAAQLLRKRAAFSGSSSWVELS